MVCIQGRLNVGIQTPTGAQAPMGVSFSSTLLQVELHVHLDGAIKPETILFYGR